MTDFPLKPRPLFAQWMFERGLEPRDVAPLLGCSHETVRLTCLPFGDEKRRVPGKALMEGIVGLTAGEVTPNSFFELHCPVMRRVAESPAAEVSA